MNVKFADKNDIESITRLRLMYFSEVYEHFSVEEKEELKRINELFLERELGQSCYVSIIEEDGMVVSSAYLSIYCRAPNRGCPNMFFGEIYGVYTNPQYRNRGYASKCIELLLSAPISKKIDLIKLDASGDGYQLYKRLGFTDALSNYTPMVLNGEGGQFLQMNICKD